MAAAEKPFSEACERNRAPILGVLQQVFVGCKTVLEIGSGTGQHAVYFASQLPDLIWQTSDLPEQHPGIRDFEAVDRLAGEQNLRLVSDFAMPANNRSLVWRKQGAR